VSLLKAKFGDKKAKNKNKNGGLYCIVLSITLPIPGDGRHNQDIKKKISD